MPSVALGPVEQGQANSGEDQHHDSPEHGRRRPVEMRAHAVGGSWARALTWAAVLAVALHGSDAPADEDSDRKRRNEYVDPACPHALSMRRSSGASAGASESHDRAGERA